MTLILAAVAADGTYIGADARSSSNYTYADNSEKLVRVKNFVIGVAGSTRVSQLVQYQASGFKPVEDDAGVFAFVSKLQALVSKDHSARPGGDVEKFSMLLAAPDAIYSIHRNYQFERHAHSWAVGSGDDFGLGYFRALSLDDTELRIRTAIEATGDYVPSVGGKVTVYKV